MPDKPTNGPYPWGSGPQPKGKSKLGRLIKAIAKLAGDPGPSGKGKGK